MKEGCPPTSVKMFGKLWKIPHQEICQEVYEVIKDKVEIVGGSKNEKTDQVQKSKSGGKSGGGKNKSKKGD
jgi:hypothetical protein